uniref:CCHC-type domain-containing protein n=1 Tax=Tanacetum cinerariifolium TaxID=118510 RepID=A0A6L2KZ62_TANCI|nr:hypothetical protein [Tanacetum cinerariifolium]
MESVLQENDRLLTQALSVEIVNIVVHDNVKFDCLNVDACAYCVTTESELKPDFIKKECYETGDVKERKVKREVEEIETLNLELDHKVTKLAAENEHLKQTYKQLFDSIKSSRVQSKEHSLKEQLNKLKGKAVLTEAVSLNPIDPALLQVDVAPLVPKLRKNRTSHTDYIRHTQEEATTLREIVESVRYTKRDFRCDSLSHILCVCENYISFKPFEEDDEEEEEHPALADSSAVPIVDLVLPAEDAEALEADEPTYAPGSPIIIPLFQTRLRRARKTVRPEPPMSASTEACIARYAALTSPPLLVPSLPLPLPSPLTTSPTNTGAPLGYRVAGIRMRALLPSTSRRTDIPEADMSPRKRAFLTTPTLGFEIRESSTAGATRQPGPTESDLRRCRVEQAALGRIKILEARDPEPQEGPAENSHMRAVGHDVSYAMPWAALKRMITSKYCPRGEIQKLESKMFPEESAKVERYIGGLPDMIHDSVKASKPLSMQEAIEFATEMMDIKILTHAERDKKPYGWTKPLCPKCNYHHDGPCAPNYTNCKKIGCLARNCKGRPAAANNNNKNQNNNNNQRAQGANARGITCFECGVLGHYNSDCLKLKNGNQGNRARNGNAMARAYDVGTAETKPNSNVVMGTFLLNNRYALVLFDTGADRSFVSTTFSSLIDIIPTILDHGYDVELADGRIIWVITLIRGCTLNFLNYPFNIDLMPVEMGSFDVIIGMDWLVKYHAVIVCDEKLVRVPFDDEILIFHCDESNNGHESRLNILSFTKTQRYLLKGCPIFLAHITTKETKDKSKEKRVEDVPIVQDFPEVFLKDFPGIPPTHQVEF